MMLVTIEDVANVIRSPLRILAMAILDFGDQKRSPKWCEVFLDPLLSLLFWNFVLSTTYMFNCSRGYFFSHKIVVACGV